MTTYKTEGVPIVIVHRGRQDYLKACISKAKQHNRNSAIILIGDTSNSDLAQIHYNIDCENSPLLKDVAAFRRLYTHRSGLSSSFERFCIERWLLIRNLMAYLDLEICCAIDSDVLFFSGAQDILDEIPGLAMSFGRWNQKMLLPHFNLIQRRDALESFCIFAVEIYKNQSRLKKLSMESSADGGRTWICDMLLFWKWSQENPHFKLAIYEEQPSKNSYFDPSVGRTEGFTHSAFHLGIVKKWKKLSFVGARAFAHDANNRLVQTKFIHYHGIFKVLMVRHARGKEDTLACFFLIIKAKLIYELSRPLRKK